MTLLKRLLFNRWVLTLLGLLLFALLIWFVGPLFAFAGYPPLGPVTHRITVILIAIALVCLPPLFRLIRDSIATKKLIAAIKDQARPDPDLLKANPNIVNMTSAFDHAVKALKKRPGRDSLYVMPWYVIIGPPGTGKTTVIEHSGLTFPSDSAHKQGPVSGIGGTRNCQWWFAQQAVLIDTAGRYFSQDSDQSQDTAEWSQFLRLLKQHRRRRPINGALVTLSLEDLVNASREQRARHAQTIKARLNELHQQLGIRVPIYFLLTKADTLPGFTDFFGELRQDEREQVWGFTLPAEDSRDFSTLLSQEFSQLLDRLNDHMVTLVHRHHSTDRRQRIIDFPKQLALHKGAIVSMLKELFTDQQVINASQLRGVYLSSGTQDGTVLRGLLSSHGITSEPLLPTAAIQGKSYFLNQLFTDVIFPEAGLVGNNPRLERWLTQGRRTAIASTGLIAALGCGAMSYNYWQNREQLQNTQARVSELNQEMVVMKQQYQTIAAIPLSRRTQLLNMLEQLPDGKGFGHKSNLWSTLRQTGLSQYPALQEQALSVYNTLSDVLLLPALNDYLSDTLQHSRQDDVIYRALKAYLMLASSQHYDGQVLLEDLRQLGWVYELKLQLTPEGLSAFDRHLQHWTSVYDANRSAISLSTTLVETNRSYLLRRPADEAVYRHIKADLQQQGGMDKLPSFTLYQAVGGLGAERMLRHNALADLHEGIAPLFTRAGYDFFTDDLPQRIKAQHRERQWVLNHDDDNESDLRKAVEALYFDEYIQQYTALLSGVEIAPFVSASQAYRLLETLINPNDSRLNLLVKNIRQQTRLTNRNAAQRFINKLSQEVASPSTPSIPSTGILNRSSVKTPEVNIAASDPVSQSFAELHHLVEGDDATALPVNRVVEKLHKLQSFLQAVAVETELGGALSAELMSTGKSIIQELRTEARVYPQPVKNILLSASVQTSNILQSGQGAAINRSWKSVPYHFCQRAINERYPFTSSSNSVNLNDFSRFFGYDGLMESFFARHLSPYVDVSSRPWKNKSSISEQFMLSKDSLRLFQDADDIKRAFFTPGSDNPGIRFTLTPYVLHEEAKQATLLVDGQRLRYQHGRTTPTTFKWPGPSARKVARLEIELFDGRVLSLEKNGDWALFQLLDQAHLRRHKTRESYRLTLSIEDYEVEYVLTAHSAFNPFQLNFRSFRCSGEL